MKYLWLLFVSVSIAMYFLYFGVTTKILYVFLAIIVVGVMRYVAQSKRGYSASLAETYEESSRNLIIYAILARVFLGMGLSQSGFDEFLAPDSTHYHFLGKLFSDVWAGGDVSELYLRHIKHAHIYHRTVAAAYYMFGDDAMVMIILNSFIGGAVVNNAYRITLNLGFNYRQSYQAAMFVAFWPSMMLWSAMNIRDVWMHYFISLSILQWLDARNSAPKIRHFVTVFICALFIYSVRAYMLPLVGASLLMAYFVQHSINKFRRTLLMIALSFLVLQLDFLFGFSAENVISELNTTRQGFIGEGVGSSFAEDVKLDSVGSVLKFLPLAMAYFLFAPFPWMLRSSLQLTTLIEMLIFYAIFPAIVKGIYVSFKRHYDQTAVIFFLTVMVSFSYAIAEGNVGTIYRHKAQILLYLLIFVPIGIAGFRSDRQKKQARVVTRL